MQKGRKSVTFAIRVRTMWYEEKVSNFEIATNSDSAKREKVCHLRIGIYIWNYYDLTKEKVSTRMVDEKSDCHLLFLNMAIFPLLKLGTQ